MKFCSYFLIVADLLQWCRTENIPTGPGRGSSAGALVAYCLFITHLDPIKYNLVFERFINPSRKGSPPDIDLDFCKERRQEVIRHIIDKFGENNVAHIGTYGTMKAKGAIRDVTRALGYEYAIGDHLAALVLPPIAGKEQTLQTCYEKVPELLDAKKGRLGDDYKLILDKAEFMEGRIRQFSSHASGILIAEDPINKVVPLFKGKDGIPVTQFDMKIVEELGLIKFDILGLLALTTIDRCLSLISKRHQIQLDSLNIPIDDEKTFDMLCHGNVTGIFQLEGSSGLQNLTIRLKPHSLEDLSLLISIYRPGPLQSGLVDQILSVRNGSMQPEYFLPELEPILRETSGCLVYQEQAMEIAKKLAGFSMAEADILRKSIGKKSADLMKQQETRFVEGMVKTGFSQQKSEQLFEIIKGFADYSFNKSHGVSYSYISYQMAYLKANYPVEFMCSCLISDSEDMDKVYKYITCCREMGISILPPDINESEENFSIDSKGAIRFGLSAIKNVGTTAMKIVKKERVKGGPYKDIIDFCSRITVDKQVVQSLILAGSFDSLHSERASALDALDDIWRYKEDIKRWESKEETYHKKLDKFLERENIRATGSKQAALKRPIKPLKPTPPIILDSLNPLSRLDQLRYESELVGYYITDHPINMVQKKYIPRNVITIDAAKEESDNERVCFLAIPILVKEITTKKKNKMAYVTVEDGVSSMELTAFPKTWTEIKSQLQKVPMIFTVNIEAANEEIGAIVRGVILGIKSIPLHHQEVNTHFTYQLSSIEDAHTISDMITSLVDKEGKNVLDLEIVLGRAKLLLSPVLTNKVSTIQRSFYELGRKNS